jgi:ribosomal protein S18 acetylase RimI-like enzyme
MEPAIRTATDSDLPRLLELEGNSFSSDRLSRRSFQHWIKGTHGILLVAECDGSILGYGLALLHKGTRLARLYSLAVDPAARGKGIGRCLIKQLEERAAARGRLYMRMEVATGNQTAIALYESMDYRIFGVYHNYYDDHNDALRMHKRIRFPATELTTLAPIPWYRQTTQFSCGPAALLMAMASLDQSMSPTQEMELDIWREATTIFMTSGHGGCHPIGLALAAHTRGFDAQVLLNQRGPLFLDGVRSQHKKEIMAVVDGQFRKRAKEAGIVITHSEAPLKKIETALKSGDAAIVLVSTYRTTGNKSPHWVTATTFDDLCLYVHDPEPAENQSELVCRHIPIAREDFEKMSVYGNSRLRTAVIIKKKKRPVPRNEP